MCWSVGQVLFETEIWRGIKVTSWLIARRLRLASCMLLAHGAACLVGRLYVLAAASCCWLQYEDPKDWFHTFEMPTEMCGLSCASEAAWAATGRSLHVSSYCCPAASPRPFWLCWRRGWGARAGLHFADEAEAKKVKSRWKQYVTKRFGKPVEKAMRRTGSKGSMFGKMAAGFQSLADSFKPKPEKFMITSGPMNFKHVVHVGLDSDGNIDWTQVPRSLQKLFKEEGISKKQLKRLVKIDPEANQKLMAVIQGSVGSGRPGGAAAMAEQIAKEGKQGKRRGPPPPIPKTKTKTKSPKSNKAKGRRHSEGKSSRSEPRLAAAPCHIEQQLRHLNNSFATCPLRRPPCVCAPPACISNDCHCTPIGTAPSGQHHQAPRVDNALTMC